MRSKGVWEMLIGVLNMNSKNELHCDDLLKEVYSSLRIKKSRSTIYDYTRQLDQAGYIKRLPGECIIVIKHIPKSLTLKQCKMMSYGIKK